MKTVEEQLKSIKGILADEPRSAAYIMPFGIHKGRDICELDDDYLLFLHEKTELTGSLKLIVAKEIKERKL